MATSTVLYGKPRIDWTAAAAGEVYYLKLTGPSSDVDLRLANLVWASPDGSEAIVHGTDGPDDFQATDVGSHTAAINSVEYHFSGLRLLQFFGGQGEDRATVTCTRGGEDAVVHAHSAVVVGADYTIELDEVDAVTLVAAGQDSQVRLHDSPGES